MLLEHLVRPLEEQLKREGEEMLECPSYVRGYVTEQLRPKFGPASTDWQATVYVHPDWYLNPVLFALVVEHYDRAFPNRGFNFEEIRPERLEERDIFKFPIAEEIFLKRGFISDIEMNDYGVGAKNPQTLYLRRNRAAAQFQIALIDYFLHRGVRPLSRTGKRRSAVGSLMSLAAGHPVPLTEIAGVLLPRKTFWRNERVHLAYELSLREALAGGREDIFNLCRSTPQDIAKQINFESRNSRLIFAGATPRALLLWQTQALAILRKAAWWIDIRRGPALYSQECTDRKEAKKKLRIMNRDPLFIVKLPEHHSIELSKPSN